MPRDRAKALLLCAALGIIVLAAALRVFALDSRINPDARRWYERSLRFWSALETGRWEPALTHHPGVPLMWLSGGAMKLVSAPPPGPRASHRHFRARLRAAKLPLAVVGALLCGVTALLLSRLLGPRYRGVALLCGLLMATEPMLAAHSRSLHLDMLYTAWAWLAVLSMALALRERSLPWAAASGALLALGVLTKVVVAGVALGIAIWCAVTWLRSRDARALACLGVATAVAFATCFLIWPPLLLSPVETIRHWVGMCLSEVGTGQAQYLLGEPSRNDPGALYYGVALLVRTTPEVLLFGAAGCLLVVRGGCHAPLRRWLGGCALAFAPAVVTLLVADKKFDRYVLMLYPVMCFAAAIGIASAFRWLCRRAPRRAVLVAAAVAAVVIIAGVRTARIHRVHPHIVAWANDYPGMPAHRAITLGNTGEGLAEAGEWILSRTGGRRPRVFVAGYHQSMPPWIIPIRGNDYERAEYIVTCVSFWQRDISGVARELGQTETPLHEVRLDGRVHARVYEGPRYRD